MTPAIPAWTLTVIAISTAVIAILLVVVAVAAAVAFRQLGARLEEQQQMLHEGRELLGLLKGEIEAVVRTSRGVRKAVVRGVRRTREKLLDLEALYDVVHDEVEETALDVASTLRGFRRGGSVLGRLRRLVIPGR